jgi:ABC-type phosphate/phosphonate transport system substrate-binding protein
MSGTGASGEGLGTSTNPVRIGISGGLFRDVPSTVVSAMSLPFNRIMSAETGMTGELCKVDHYTDLAQQITDNRLQIGILTGYELAWARKKFPDLKPLTVAVSGKHKPQALVVVAANSDVEQWSDLKGKTLSRPRCTRPHAMLFLERNITALKQDVKNYFAKVNINAESSEALDDVADGVSEAALVDNVVWDAYKKSKPKRSAQLRIAIESEMFPPTVVTYYPGNLDSATIKQFRKGMLNAHESATGKQLMSLWKMTGFEEVPEDYEKSLKEIAEAYPPPAKTDAKK